MVYRSRFKEIVYEFTIPQGRQRGIVILLNGMPSVPKLNDLLEILAANGYLTVFPRYQGTWESSGTFLAQSPVKDIQSLCNEILRKRKIVEVYTHREFKIITRNLILIGTSFGGSVALCAASWQSAKKIIALSPVIDWKTCPETATSGASEHMKQFLREGFGEGYRFTDIGWEKFRTGALFSPSRELIKNVAKKITVVYDESDKTIPPAEIVNYAKANGIALNKVKGLGHISFSKFPHKNLIHLLVD